MAAPLTIIGIDPGLSGAVAIITNAQEPPSPVLVWDTPVTTRIVNKKTRRVYDPPAMAQLLKATIARHAPTVAGQRNVLLALEESMPMQHDGRVQAFGTGRSGGLWEGMLAMGGLPYRRVRAVDWKRAFGLLKQKKAASLALARQWFPSVDLHLAKHEGRAEALLIAEWLRREYIRDGAVARGPADDPG